MLIAITNRRGDCRREQSGVPKSAGTSETCSQNRSTTVGDADDHHGQHGMPKVGRLDRADGACHLQCPTGNQAPPTATGPPASKVGSSSGRSCAIGSSFAREAVTSAHTGVLFKPTSRDVVISRRHSGRFVWQISNCGVESPVSRVQSRRSPPTLLALDTGLSTLCLLRRHCRRRGEMLNSRVALQPREPAAAGLCRLRIEGGPHRWGRLPGLGRTHHDLTTRQHLLYLYLSGLVPDLLAVGCAVFGRRDL